MLPISLATAERTAALFWPAFVEREGLIGLPWGSAPDLRHFATRTEAEAFASHTHLLDEFRHRAPWGPDPTMPPDSEVVAPDWTHPDYLRACALARTLGAMWLRKLEADFPGDAFRVYVTTRVDPIVRFHRVYAGERPWATDEEAAAKIASGEVSVFRSTSARPLAAI